MTIEVTTDTEFVTGISSRLGPRVRALDFIPPFPPHPIPRGAKPSKVPGDYHPRLSLTERDRRWDALRKDMLMANLDVLVLLGNDIYWDMGIANIRYVTGIAAKMGSNALFFMDEDPVLYNAVAHMSQPFHFQEALNGWVEDIRIGHGIPEIAAELKDRGLGGARVGLVGFSSTIQTTSTILSADEAALKALLPEAQLVDFGYAFQKLRMVKSAEEIGMLRKAAVVAEKTIEALVGAAKVGATEAEVYAEMVRTQIANGGEPNIFNLFASGPVEHPESELWHLLHGSDQPMVPTMRPIADGDLVVAEWHTKWGGYLVHTEYSCHVGPRVPPALLRLFDVALECFEASKSALVPGKTIAEAVAEIRKPAAKAGVNWVELGFHAMGLASPEFPTVVYDDGYGSRSLNGSGIGHLVLEEGMHFGNNIDLHDQSWKSDVGIMYGGSMIVRRGGAEVLVNPPKELGVS
ncbi:M24 family metallopeptidase [Paenarthrobacter sp. RAF54_2]|uniref:M24 family metallopeptidase n=1 Tax=Paenarthrobacter sp. RAF54_2 TaxID=3233061 RepID=UPI003F9AD67B